MRFIADFHIHSHYSIATSKKLVPEHLEYWARLKGIEVIGTGDCVHPGWYSELSEKLESAGNGLYRLKEEYRLDESRALKGDNLPREINFLLTAEISNIYKKAGKVRKVHNILVFPDLKSVAGMQSRLERVGNIKSDGRPILGLDSRILLEMLLETDERAYLIPAHVWTPWFSVLGSKSGFNTVEECYEDLTQYIPAVETGLSSDPAMNRTCSFLDRFKLVSNSDAHSPEKLGREANLFNTEISYSGIINALRGDRGFEGTIEFFPQEGKYHYDGHRKCGIRWDPLETLRHHGICPVCGKPVTRGVMYRVAELADREEPVFRGNEHFYSITQLSDLIAQVLGQKSSSSKTVQRKYHEIIKHCGSEFHVLLFADPDDIGELAGAGYAEAISRVRQGMVNIEEGYDGEFGSVRVCGSPEEIKGGAGLFDNEACSRNKEVSSSEPHYRHSIRFDIAQFRKLSAESGLVAEIRETEDDIEKSELKLSSLQKEAVNIEEGPCMIIAGPGTGKTRVLVERIKRLISDKQVNPESILALTFSNRACREIEERLKEEKKSIGVTASTFHSFGLNILREHFDRINREVDFTVIDQEEQTEIVRGIVDSPGKAASARKAIEEQKSGFEGTSCDPGLFAAYENELASRNALDFADLLRYPLDLFVLDPQLREKYSKKYEWVLVDEFQDLSPQQYDFVRILAGTGEPNICVIGDPDQAIYAFRGSDRRIIERFRSDYQGSAEIRLDHSYRCPEMVIRGAGQVLGPGESLSGTERAARIEIMSMRTDRSEAEWIAREIESSMGGVRSFSRDSGISDGQESSFQSFSDYAILCRSSFMFPVIEEALANHGISWQRIGTEPFYRLDPWAPVMRAFRSVYHGRETELLSKKIYNQLAEEIKTGESCADCLEKIMTFMQLAEKDMLPLARLASTYGNRYDDFFNDLVLRQGADEYSAISEAVSLMTIHAAKGLEFNCVFIPGCEQGIIPFELFGNQDQESLGEEQRLLYVGMTRAKERLVLSHAGKRNYRGRFLKNPRSDFLDSIEKELLRTGRAIEKTAKKEDTEQMSLF